jgi:hypothetical protein
MLASPIQNQFNAGELSPRLYARTDLAQYAQGCRTLENFLPLPHGGATRRGGTRHVAAVKSAAHPPRLIPFIFNASDAYVLELGHDGTAGYIRFFRDQGQIISGGPYEIAAPYAEAELFEVMFVQSADTMYLVHPNHKPRTLTRTGHTSWTLANFAPTADPFTSTNNYPSAVAFFEQRLIFGGTNTNPFRLWFSKSAAFNDFTTGTGASDAFTVDIAAERGNVVRWICGSTDVFAGTTGGVARHRSAAPPLTPTNGGAKRVLTNGVAYRTHLAIDNRLLFVERFGKPSNVGRKLRDTAFNFADDEYTARDLTLLSDHIGDRGLVDLAWQEQPDRVIWAVLGDGGVASLTYNPAELVVAWARHPLGGSNVLAKSVAAIPGALGDEVWLVVGRTINGQTAVHVEFIDPAKQPNCRNTDACVIGSNGSPTTVWSGFGHLVGQTVKVVADSAPVADAVVDAGGNITLAVGCLTLEAGLGYSSVLKTLNLEAAARDGTAQGKPKSIWKVVLRLQDTVGIKVAATDDASGEEIVFRETDDLMDAAVPRFSGDKEIHPPTGWSSTGAIEVRQDNPLPCTVLGLMPRVEGHDA